MPDFPPSLATAVLARAIKTSTGELGICREDVDEFLGACFRDCINVLGWEIWLVDHAWSTASSEPQPAAGGISGIVPMLGSEQPSIVGGSGDLEQTAAQIASAYWEDFVDQHYTPHLRFNFTLVER